MPLDAQVLITLQEEKDMCLTTTDRQVPLVSMNLQIRTNKTKALMRFPKIVPQDQQSDKINELQHFQGKQNQKMFI